MKDFVKVNEKVIQNESNYTIEKEKEIIEITKLVKVTIEKYVEE